MPSSCVIFLIFLPAALSFLVGGWLLRSRQRFVWAARQTTGRVVQIDRANGAYDIEFTIDDGTTLRAKSPIRSNSPAYQVGDTVSILYDPRRPAYIRENRFRDLWAVPYALTFGGGFVVVICLLLLIYLSP